MTAEQVLIVLNGVLATATVATAIVGVETIKASSRVAEASETQATATTKAVELTDAGLTLERQAIQTSVRPIIVDVPREIFRPPNNPDPGAIDWFPTGDGAICFMMRIRNIGSGAAILHGAVYLALIHR